MAKCKVCKTVYTKSRPMQSCCSVPCAIEHAKTKRIAKDRKETRQALEKFKRRTDYIAEAQKAVNAWVRVRDMLAGVTCICCGKPLDFAGRQVDAGHYRSTGSAPHMRFMALMGNINAQRKHCNRWRAGRALDQKQRIVERYGQDMLDAIESDQTSRKYTIEELQEIASGFRQWARELQKEKSRLTTPA